MFHHLSHFSFWYELSFGYLFLDAFAEVALAGQLHDNAEGV
jgi:hypothetical protein